MSELRKGAWTVRPKNGKPPCYGCTGGRSENCHAKCESYKAWKQLEQEKKERIRAEKEKEYALNHMKVGRGFERR